MRELTSKLPLPDVPHGTEGLIQTIWLLMTATIAVPLICKLPGGSPVLGFLVNLLAPPPPPGPPAPRAGGRGRG